MRYLRAALDQLLKMFVTDWTQTLVTIAILVAAGLTIHRWHSLPELGFGLAVLVTAQLFYSTWTETKRRRAKSAA